MNFEINSDIISKYLDTKILADREATDDFINDFLRFVKNQQSQKDFEQQYPAIYKLTPREKIEKYKELWYADPKTPTEEKDNFNDMDILWFSMDGQTIEILTKEMREAMVNKNHV